MAVRSKPTFAVTLLRLVLAGNDSLLLASSLVVLAVQGSLIAAFPEGSGSHNVYELTIVRFSRRDTSAVKLI
jgi:hypothetical protein